MRGGLGFSRRLLWGSDSLDDVQRKKLAVTYGVFVFLEENEGLETTRAWFFGANTRLEVSEFEALRDGEFDAAWARHGDWLTISRQALPSHVQAPQIRIEHRVLR